MRAIDRILIEPTRLETDEKPYEAWPNEDQSINKAHSKWKNNKQPNRH